jgi:hypothetical protein
VINNKTPQQALSDAAAKEQKLLDDFWAKKGTKP